MLVSTSQLKSFLQDAGLVKLEDLKKAEAEAKETKNDLGEVLIQKKLISKEELRKLEAYILGIPFINLRKENIPKKTLLLIPEQIAQEHHIVAFRRNKKNLEVAMLDPEDLQIIEFIKKKTGLNILPRLTDEESLNRVFKQYHQDIQEEFKEIIQPSEGKTTLIKEDYPDLSKKEIEKASQDLPVIKIVEAILRDAVLKKASDIHIEPTEKDLIIRYRIDGILRDMMTLPKQIQLGITARIKILSNLKIDEHRLPQDGRFKIETEGQKVDFRVSIIPVYDGEKIVMRLLPENPHRFTLGTLGFEKEQIEILQRNLTKPNGMILATGPTGSGKTTTLYTMMTILNKPDVNISTLEDPVEYRMPRVNQTQINSQVGLTFANGLRSLLRQDPNIIMVGEIRDNETASLAINAALTGHLVLSTLHTNSAAGALPRLIDMRVEPFLIASTVNCIIAQRLVRCLIPENRQAYRLTTAEVKNLKERFDLDTILKTLKNKKVVKPNTIWEKITFYRPQPTEDSSSGYSGRIGIHEILEISNPIRKLISQKVPANQIEIIAKKEGMLTMLEDGFIKAVRGITSLEEVIRTTKE